MISLFNISGYEITADLAYRVGPLGVDEFAYYIGFFKNAADNVDPVDYTNVVQGLGYTVINDYQICYGNYAFLVTPWNFATEALARAEALTAINNVVSGLAALGY